MNPSTQHFLDPLPAANAEAKVILVVDDDPALVNLLREDLQEEGYEVLCGFDGQMAIQMARQKRPDLVILDINMPMTNGFKTFEFLRGNENTRLVPIIFVSGELSKDVYPRISNQPRIAHLKKPMDLENLNSMVRHFLAQYPVSE